MSDTILVSEIFGPTIQGEGAMIGTQTHFIRFAGCDYRCKMCDSMHAVDPVHINANATRYHPDDLMLDLMKLGDQYPNINWITFSGGNPCIWDLQPIMVTTRSMWKIAVETQGTIWQDWIHNCQQLTISPKGPGMGENCDLKQLDDFIVQSLRSGISTCLKVVIFGDDDLDFAEELHRKYLMFPFYLSVGNSTFNLNADAEAIRPSLLHAYKNLVEKVTKNRNFGDAIILPQMHTLLWGNKQGV